MKTAHTALAGTMQSDSQAVPHAGSVTGRQGSRQAGLTYRLQCSMPLESSLVGMRGRGSAGTPPHAMETQGSRIPTQ